MSHAARDRLLNHPYAQKAVAQVRRHRVWLYALAGLIVLFGVLGYFWLPGFAKGKAEALLTEKLHRPVTIERIEISPYRLAATIHGFRIGEKEGDAALLSFDLLHVNLSAMSIARRAPVISEITLQGPAIHLARNTDGSLSITDLIEEFSKEPPSDEPARFSVSNIRIEGGSIVFEDKQKHVTQRISDLKLGVPFVANFESAEEVWVQPHFSARINDGASLVFEGRARPFADKREVVLDIKLDALDLTGIDEYVPLPGGIKLLAGLVDTQLEVNFVQADKHAAAIRIDGDISLRDLDVDNKAGLPWRVRGERLNLHLDKLDPTLQQPLKVALDVSNLRLAQGDKPEMKVDRLSLSDVVADINAHKVAFALDSTINGKGLLKAKGSAAWAPVAADVEIDAEQVDIVALQGWALDSINRPFLALTKGAIGFKGQVQASGQPLNVAVKGDASINNFNLLDKRGAEELLSWKSLEVSGIDVKTAPLSVDVRSIVQSDLFARITILPDGRVQLRDMMAPGTTPAEHASLKDLEQSAKKEVAANPNAPVASPEATAPVAAKDALPVRIGELQFKNGNIIFNDYFIKPNYRANLTQLVGKIGPLQPGKPGLIDIKGSVNRAAPLSIKGKVDPFGKELYLDLAAKMTGMELPGFSPYSGRYIGYAIDKGKLSVDLHYYIEKGQLRAENNIFLDQLTLGDKIESPDALSLPVSLAISLLKNSRGEIDLNLPISGSINDPQFSVGGLVIKVFVNLIVKAVTAPFALLGSMFGGGADLSYVEFAPGYARLTPESDKSLTAIGKAMADRPGLKVEITGVANSSSDAAGLKQATLERRVRAQKLADLAKQGKSSSLDEVSVSAAEYPKYLEQAYKAEKFDKPKNMIGMSKSLPVAEMEALMLANLPAGSEEMRALAERRARAARDALIDKGAASERLFVVQPKTESQPEGNKPAGRVDFSLR